jgi:uncharacterized membrane protein YczE
VPPRLHPARARLLSRCAELVLGCAISTASYALTVRAGLGLGPLFVVQDGLSRHLGFSLGTAVMVVGAASVLVSSTLRAWPGPGTLVLPFLGGGLMDVLLPAVPTPHGVVVRMAAVIGATWLMALGGALVIGAALGPAAYDLVMLGLHRRVGGPIAAIRVGMELTMLACGWLLGGAIGLGTVVTGLLIGPSMHMWLAVLGRRRTAPALTPLPLGLLRLDSRRRGSPPR